MRDCFYKGVALVMMEDSPNRTGFFQLMFAQLCQRPVRPNSLLEPLPEHSVKMDLSNGDTIFMTDRRLASCAQNRCSSQTLHADNDNVDILI